jgi:hypothetical protein
MYKTKKPVEAGTEMREPHRVRREGKSLGRRGDLIKVQLEKLADTTRPADVRDLFSQFGEVSLVSIHSDSRSTWGFVELFENDDAEEISWFEPLFLCGQRLHFQEC